MTPLLIINHTLALVLEIILLVLLGLWAFTLLEGSWLGWLAVLMVLAVAIALWGRFAAPKSSYRLAMPTLLMFKIGMFASGTLSAWVIGYPLWALLFGGASAVHLALAAWLDAV